MASNTYVDIDELLKFRNMNKPSGEPSWTRMDLGRKIFPDRPDTTISSTLSYWQNGRTMPSLTCAGVICKLVGIDYNTFVKKYVKILKKAE